jgi:hypothetical protein
VTISVADLDAWRDAYPTATYLEQQAFHSRIWEANPDQNHFDIEQARLAIEHVNPSIVVELGGWDGALAALMLALFPIKQWTNHELCAEAASVGVGQHPRYSVAVLNDFYWCHDWRCDLFVASHVIEHLTTEDLDKTIAATDTPAIYLDAPLLDDPTPWTGTTTTHILQLGWEGVTALLDDHGYTLTWAHDHETAPHTGGHARACLYERR